MKRVASVIGNILEHYDSALFGLLAPFLAPLFFAGYDPITALIMTYGMMPLGILTKPLGAVFFGWIGDTFGRKQALTLSLLGMAFTTFSMGFLPVYAEVGVLAPMLLATLRMLQSFFMAGESVGGAIYVLEHTPSAKHSFMSSLYDASTLVGILVASSLVGLISAHEVVETAWRYLFWGGGITAFFGLWLRRIDHDAPIPTTKPPVLAIIRAHLRPLIGLILASGFTYITYIFSFDFMNGYIPLITTLTKAEVMKLNSWLLVLDMLLLPCFGYLAYKIGKEKVMITAALVLGLGAMPLFWCLESASLTTILIVRCIILTAGVAFAAPYHAWALSRVPKQARYTILSLGYTLGSQAIGMPAASVSLYLYKVTHQPVLVGLYLAVFGLLAALTVYATTISSVKDEPALLTH
ncbi:MAG: MFS transporter [Chlamydiales bacterium]|nr:MFS transporter [Chlamydiales bacterium]